MLIATIFVQIIEEMFGSKMFEVLPTWLAVVALLVGAYGLFLAFAANIALGVAVLFFPRVWLAIALTMIVTHVNLAQGIVHFAMRAAGS